MANGGKSNGGSRAQASDCRGTTTSGVERGSPRASTSCHHPRIASIDFTSPPPAPGTQEEQNDAARYLDELVRDMRKLNAIQKTSPSLFLHARYLLTSEMDRIWNIIYRSSSNDHQSHSPQDYQCTSMDQPTITLQQKVPIPQATGCNYICRILGPRGKTVRRLEAESGCHILIRGEGSLKNPRRESRLKKYAGWEHLLEPLHVLVIAFDVSKANCKAKLAAGVNAVTQLINAGADINPPPQLLHMPPINPVGKARSEATP